MFDPSTISAALGSAKAILDIAKSANDLNVAVKINAEVANLQGRLIEAQQQALELQHENQRLQTEIDKSRNYVQHHSVVWKVRPEGSEDGPFCPTCIGGDREIRLVLRDHVDQSGPNLFLHCPKTHHGPGVGHWQEQKYVIPKDLVPENYFFIRTSAFDKIF